MNIHDNITVRILAYHDNHANDNAVDITYTKSLSAIQYVADATLKCIVPLAASALPL